MQRVGTSQPCCDGYGLNGGICSKCSVGLYSKNQNCESCPHGHVPAIQLGDMYSFAKNGSHVCYACENGTNAQNNRCVACSSGKYESDSTCQMCEVGRYQPNERQQQCLLCEAGFYQNETGLDSCKACPENHYSSSEASSCLPCPNNTKSPLGAATCDANCPNGTFTTGSTCSHCPAGTFKPSELDQDDCQACPSGHIKKYSFES